ncbi:MAG: DUF2066 domain-containing protein [Alphaproteobacteria bacterium]
MIDQWRVSSFLPAAVFSALILLTAPSTAQGVDPFTLEDVPIDARAGDTRKARARALAMGRAQAFRLLLRRLANTGDYGKLPKLDDAGIIGMIDGFSVREEKSSAVRYLALMTVRFKPGDIRALLKGAGVAYVDTPSRPVLVLPVYRSGKRVTLWETPNAWRDAWGRAPLKGGLVPFVLALGDLGDLGSINAKSALSGNKKKLAAIVGRYNAGEVLVALAHESKGKDGKPRLGISLWRFVPLTGMLKPAGRFRATRGKDRKAMFLAAASAVARRIESRWKRENQAIIGGEPKILRVLVAIESLGQWTDIRQRISEVPVIKSTTVIKLSRQQAELELKYVGDLGRLRADLAQRNIALVERPEAAGGDAPGWLLRLGAAGTGGPAKKGDRQ